MLSNPKLSLSADNKLIVEVSPTYISRMRMMPGARALRDHTWELPATWASLVSIGALLPTPTVKTPAVEKFVEAEKSRVLRIMDLKSSGVASVSFPGARPYQNVGAEFLNLAGSALLADDQGLGKTIQALLVAADERRVLVVTTTSMKHKWADEAKRWAPNHRTFVIDGNAPRRKELLDAANAYEGAHLVIINWELLRRHSRLAPFGAQRLSDEQRRTKELNEGVWDLVIADEVHKAKSPKAQQTRALWGIASKRRIGLTGTPLVQDLGDLWSVMRFVSPDEWPTRSKFYNRYCITAPGWHGGLDIIGLNPATESEFRTVFEPRYLRRTKDEVETLPPKTFERLLIPMHSKQSSAYRRMAKEMILEAKSGFLVVTDPLTLVGQLRYLASASVELNSDGRVERLVPPSNKLEAFRDIVESAAFPVVGYADSRKLVEMVGREMEASGYTVGYITGAVPAKERFEVEKRFQAGEYQCLLMTSAGAEGLTLTAADTFVFLQPPYSNKNFQQAQDRISRIGQDKPVTIVTLISEGSIDMSAEQSALRKDRALQEVVRDIPRLKGVLYGT